MIKIIYSFKFNLDNGYSYIGVIKIYMIKLI